MRFKKQISLLLCVVMVFSSATLSSYASDGTNAGTPAIINTAEEITGLVVNYFAKSKIVQVQLTGAGIKNGDTFLITGPTTGAVEGVIDSLHIDGIPAEQAEKGSEITFPFDTVVRKNDSFYILQNNES